MRRAVAFGVWILIAGCGAAAGPSSRAVTVVETPTSTGPQSESERAPASPLTVSLPRPKTFQERYPEFYDEDKCFKDPSAPGGRVCPAPAGGPIASLPTPSEPRDVNAWGYVGPGFVPELPSDAAKRSVQVVAESVRVSSVDGRFYLLGLVRNLSTVQARGVTVSATADATSVTGEVSVSGLRSGEPAPFRILLEVEIDPSTVVFSVVAARGGATREFEIAQTRRIQYGDRPRAPYATLWTDPPSGPMPLVDSGSFQNLSHSVVENPRVTVAWIDTAGGVIWMESKVATTIDQQPVSRLDIGGVAAYAFVLSGERAVLASAGSAAVWVDAA